MKPYSAINIYAYILYFFNLNFILNVFLISLFKQILEYFILYWGITLLFLNSHKIF